MSDFCKVEKEIHHGLHTILKDGFDTTGVNSQRSASRIVYICYSAILYQSKWQHHSFSMKTKKKNKPKP